MKQDYDILIVGAGIVGSSLALALSNLPLKLALIEKMPFKCNSALPLNSKAIALNVSSIRILQTLNLWSALAPYSNPIESVHISQQGYFAQSRISAKDMGVPQLGCVIPAAHLGKEFIEALTQRAASKTSLQASFDLFNPAECQAIKKLEQGWEVTLTQQDKKLIIYPRLVIAADGSDSTVRNLLNMGITTRRKTELALTTTLDISRHHRHIAYQRFTDNGIIACLPLIGDKIGVVWTAAEQTINELQLLPTADFLEKLQRHFSYRFGKLLLNTKPQVYSLKSFIAETQAQPGLILLGNAAHTLLPIAAQGLNLALQDMSELADIIANALSTKKDLADSSLSLSYLNARLTVHKQMRGFTEQLVERFQTGFKSLTFIYNNGLLIMDLFSPCKRSLSRRLMGIHGRLPSLVRGLTLKQEEY